jgi:hydroxylaminobenzene mutase
LHVRESRTGAQAHRLLQIGVTLFLFALLVGIAIPSLPVPRLGLSTHLLAISQGLFLVSVGLIWPRLQLTPRIGASAFWLLVYGCAAALGANLMAAIWVAGNTLLPMAAGTAHGTPLQEGFVVAALRTGGAALIVGTALVLWGLRHQPRSAAGENAA